MAEKITGTTVLTGLLGSPVAHSLSPLMHNESFQALGLDYAYLCFDVGTDRLKEAVEGLRAMGARGWNLTMPDKNLMCELCDKLSPGLGDQRSRQHCGQRRRRTDRLHHRRHRLHARGGGSRLSPAGQGDDAPWRRRRRHCHPRSGGFRRHERDPIDIRIGPSFDRLLHIAGQFKRTD